MRLRLFGDSILRGHTVVTRPDLMTSEEATAVPLWPVRSPYSVINLLFGAEVAQFVGRLKLPGVRDSVGSVRQARLSGEIRPDDTVIMLDVGPHCGDPDALEHAWRRLRAEVTKADPFRLLICEGFDNGAGGRETHIYERPIGGRSMNDAIRSAATEPQPTWAGRTEFVPLAQGLADYHRWLKARFGLSGYDHDDVHLTVWGQFRLCALLLRAALSETALPLDNLLRSLSELEQHLELKGTDLRTAVEAAFEVHA